MTLLYQDKETYEKTVYLLKIKGINGYKKGQQEKLIFSYYILNHTVNPPAAKFAKFGFLVCVRH